MKAFISYSHADEALVNELKTHLGGLERTQLVASWYDRKITPGTAIDQKILAELSESQLILLVISANFISSSYCMDVEVEQALEQHKVGRSRVVPIIVRPEASWTTFPFGSFLALPTDGRAVTSWGNRDEAWVNVVTGVREVVHELRAAIPTAETPSLKPVRSYIDELEFVDTPYVHPRARKLILSDIFVYPDLELMASKNGGRLKRSAERALQEGGLMVVVGDRQSGKTSLLKKFAIDTLSKGDDSVFFDAKGQNLANLCDTISKVRVGKIGLGSETSELKLVVIDNFDLGRNLDAGAAQLSVLLADTKKVFISVSVDAMYSADFAKHGIREADAYTINRLNVSKRRKLIEKWIRLQSEDSDQSIREAVDRREEELNSILRRNVVPALPGHVLLVLQSLESISISKTELTSYGHCYNLMIVAALGKAGVKPFELDTYINVLTELSYAMHVLGIRAIEERELVAFFISYRKSFLAPNIDDLVRTLIDSGLMRRENGGYVVYRYVSGYFAGRYIAEALSNNDAAHKRLSFLADNAHNDDCALVLLFVCHHTKNPAAMETILLNLMVALDTFPASKLAREEFEPLADILNSLPQAMLLAEPIAVARERISAREEDSNRVACEIDDISLELEPSGALARLLRAVKALEITGQLVRNRHGSLPVDQLHQLVSEAITCAQRVAGFILEMSRGMKDELPELIATMRREHPKLSSEKIESDLRGFLMFICHFSLHGLLRLVSQQLTNDALKPLVLDVLKDRQDDFSLLLQAHIKLKLEDQAVVREMQDLVPTLGKNSFTFSLLQHAVADRLQLFDIPYDDKQRIAEMFKIGVPTQVALNQPTFGRRK